MTRVLGSGVPGVARGPAVPAADGRPARWRAAGAGLARRHWPALLLLAAGLVLRVLVQFAYRPALFYIDTERYLYNAAGMDPVGYKGPLLALLSAGGFSAVAAVQHLLGLAMAVVIYLLLLRRGVSRWLAALAIAPVLLDAYQLQNEQAIMPGTWFEALIVAGLAILLWRPGPGWRAAVAAGLVLGTSATFAQVGEALIVPGVIFLLAAGGGWRRAAVRAAAFCAAFALPIAAYCTVSYVVAGDFFLSHTGVTSFYGRAAAAADCATLRLPAAERGMCPSPAQQAKGPDWLEYEPGSPIRPYYAKLPRAETDSLLSDFNHRVLAQQPQRLLGAYARDVVKLFALTRETSPGDTPVSRWQFQTTFPYFSSHSTRPEVTGRDRPVRRGRPGCLAAGRRVPALLPARRRVHARPAAGPVRGHRPGRVRGAAAAPLAVRPGHPVAGPGLPAVLRLGRVRAAGVRPVRVLVAVPAARAGHAGAGRRPGDRRPEADRVRAVVEPGPWPAGARRAGAQHHVVGDADERGTPPREGVPAQVAAELRRPAGALARPRRRPAAAGGQPAAGRGCGAG